MTSFCIVIDTREKNPVLFDKVGDPKFKNLNEIIWLGLPTGDYSIQGMTDPETCDHSITIERKSLDDLFGSTGRGRDRFEKEYIRMSKFDYAELVVEADLKTIFKNPPPLSSMVPRSVYRTILAWSQRYKVNAWFCPNRQFCERHIYLSLKRFFDDRQIDGVMEFCKL